MITTATVAVAVRLPEVPVIVTIASLLTGAELLAVSVSELEVPVGFGTQEAVTPAGRPDVTAKFTLPLNPFAGVEKIVTVPEVPG